MCLRVQQSTGHNYRCISDSLVKTVKTIKKEVAVSVKLWIGEVSAKERE